MDLFGTLLARIRLRKAPMTRPESIAALAAAFTTNGVPADTVDIYLAALADIPPDELQEAVVHIIETQEERWFPTVATIRRVIFERRLALPTPEQAWDLIQNDVYRVNAPRPVRESVAALGGMYTLGQLPAGMGRSQFIAQYHDARQRAISEESRESRIALPPARRRPELVPGTDDTAA